MFQIPEWMKTRRYQESEDARRSLEAVRGMLDAEMVNLRKVMRKATERREADHAAD